jgi:DNA-binding NarL/FixJ family response regulator
MLDVRILSGRPTRVIIGPLKRALLALREAGSQKQQPNRVSSAWWPPSAVSESSSMNCFALEGVNARKKRPWLLRGVLREPKGQSAHALPRGTEIATAPDILVVVLSGSECRGDILRSLSAGAHGYIVKNQQTDQLIRRLRHILSGEVYVPASLAELLPDSGGVALAEPVAHVSKRQRQVLKGLVEGKSNKEIAQVLNVAEGTVKLHLAALFRQLGASNRAHAAALGKQLVG